MKRRDFLKYTSGLASLVIVDSVLAQALWIPNALGNTIPLASLQSALDPSQALVLANPKEKRFQDTLISSNKRTQLVPAVRVLCRTPEAVGICILWAKQNNIPMAMRNGGHSYEGFSQSTGIVIDVRMMDSISISNDAETLTTGGGAVLGRVYLELAKKGRVIPAGSCPTVGITGHTTGGGYGLLARPFGLACDSLKSVEMVNAAGTLITVNEKENADLFWAIRGGGSGNFGIITKLQFQTHVTAKATTFVSGWTANKKTATQLLKAWQVWAPSAPDGITTLLKFSKSANAGEFTVRLVGQSINSAKALQTELDKNIFSIKSPNTHKVETKTFVEAVKQFSGDKAFPKTLTYPSVYMKGKSDYVKKVITDDGYDALFDNLQKGISVIFDAYGAQIRALSDTDTAFPHRENTICSVQYYSEWSEPDKTESKLQALRDIHEHMREYMSGGAYVNYCDLDIKNYAEAYWGQNLPRLIEIKSVHDPENFFKHAQSIPVKN